MLGSILGSEGTLLCIGKDGHIAIEFVDACNGPDFGSRVDRAESDACGPCQDIQFICSPAFVSAAFGFSQTPSLVSPVPIAPAVLLKAHSDSLVNLPEKLHHKFLVSLRSVVLLI